MASHFVNTTRYVVVSGGTGFVGRALCSRLAARGFTPLILTRGSTATFTHSTCGSRDLCLYPSSRLTRCSRKREIGHEYIGWGQVTNSPKPFPYPVEAVFNLAGEPVFSARPWSSAFRADVQNSRVEGTRALVDAIARTPQAQRPKVLVNASGVGIYPSAPDASARSAPVFDETYAGAKGAGLWGGFIPSSFLLLVVLAPPLLTL